MILVGFRQIFRSDLVLVLETSSRGPHYPLVRGTPPPHSYEGSWEILCTVASPKKLGFTTTKKLEPILALFVDYNKKLAAKLGKKLENTEKTAKKTAKNRQKCQKDKKLDHTKNTGGEIAKPSFLGLATVLHL